MTRIIGDTQVGVGIADMSANGLWTGKAKMVKKNG
jgi:hypothetical protein